MNSHQSLINKINEYSISSKPFLLIVDFEMQKPLLYQMHELDEQVVCISFPMYKSNCVPAVSADHNNYAIKQKTGFQKIGSLNKDEYKKSFDQVMQQLKYGNSYLTNLTGKTEVETDDDLNTIYSKAQAPYKIKFKDEWVCFSPECFIKIIEGHIFSYPMKGTIDADLPDAATTLLTDEKELAEHYTIVDLIRNDLSMVAQNVVVEKFRYLDKIHSNNKNLLQASSVIKGTLAPGYQSNLGELLFNLLPAGSVSGAPKKKTLEIIQQSETGARGYYTGVAFCFDGQQVDSCVLIRFIEKENEKYYYRSGGGITVNSEMEKEYQELNDKIYVPVY